MKRLAEKQRDVYANVLQAKDRGGDAGIRSFGKRSDADCDSWSVRGGDHHIKYQLDSPQGVSHRRRIPRSARGVLLRLLQNLALHFSREIIRRCEMDGSAGNGGRRRGDSSPKIFSLSSGRPCVGI